MRAKVCIGLMAGLFFTTSYAKADSFYVRNRPFTQVIQNGSQAFVSLESFLGAIGMNWESDGKVVTITRGTASNPPIATGMLTIKYGDQQVELDASSRGSSTFVSLRPVAELLGYKVLANRQTGIVDIIQAHVATAKDKALLADLEQSKLDRERAINDAWTKKSAELKAKRKAAADAEAATKTTDNSTRVDTSLGDGQTPKNPSNLKEGKDFSQKSQPTAAVPNPDSSNPTAAAPTPAKTIDRSIGGRDSNNTNQNTSPVAANGATSASTTNTTKSDKPAPKLPRLEVIRADANADYSTGIVTIQVQVKNDGDGPATSVGGQLTVVGPADSTTQGTQTGAAGVNTKVWLQQYISGPTLAPDGTWNYETTYRHPDGASIPHGDIKVELNLPKSK